MFIASALAQDEKRAGTGPHGSSQSELLLLHTVLNLLRHVQVLLNGGRGFGSERFDGRDIAVLRVTLHQNQRLVVGAQTPFGRPGQPAELASIYVQLAASDASYATGQIYGSSVARVTRKAAPT